MNLESQVCSLELAKQLKSLGVKQESLFYWAFKRAWEPTHPNATKDEKDGWIIVDEDYILSAPSCSAFTVAELGRMLPDIIHNVMRENYTLTCQKVGLWEIGYVKVNGVMLNQEVIEDGTEADARAKMLIWLIQNGYVDPKEK